MNRTRLVIGLLGFFLLQQVAGIANACQMSGAMESMNGNHARHAEHVLNTDLDSHAEFDNQTDSSTHQHHQLSQNENPSIKHDNPANCCDAGLCAMTNCHSAVVPLSAALNDWNIVHSLSPSLSPRTALNAVAVSLYRPPIVA